jgi:hypothetical protein
MPGTVWTKVTSVDYGEGWVFAETEHGYELTSTGTPLSDAVIHREPPEPDVPVNNAPIGTKISVNGTNAAVRTP